MAKKNTRDYGKKEPKMYSPGKIEPKSPWPTDYSTEDQPYPKALEVDPSTGTRDPAESNPDEEPTTYRDLRNQQQEDV